MRELKFRAWDTKTKKMDYEPYIYGCETSCVEYDEVNLNKALARGGDADCGDSRIFEQYTGLKDKNGKEIYEGDIVKLYLMNKLDGVFVCLWDNLNGEYVWSKTNNPDDAGWGGFPVNVEFRIIGNIHENQDLIVNSIDKEVYMG